MRKHTTLATLAAAATVALLTACSSNDDINNTPLPIEEPQVGEFITITAAYGEPDDEQQPETRLTHIDNGTSGMAIAWKASNLPDFEEAFMLFKDGTGEKFTLQSGGGTTTGTFGGTTPSHTSDETYHAFYPASKASATSWEDCTFNVEGQVQAGVSSTNHLTGFHYMTMNATQSTPPATVVFEHQVSILKVGVTLPTGTTPRSLTLRTPLEEIVTVRQAKDGTNISTATEQILTLKAQDGTGNPDYSTFTAYMAILPTTISDGGYQIEIAAKNGDNKDITYYYTVDTPANTGRVFTAGKMYTITLTTEGSTPNLSIKDLVWNDATLQANRLLGLGTAARPYLISTGADLKCFFDRTDSDSNPVYCAKSTNNSTNAIYLLEHDIELATNSRTSQYFYGKFDGGGNTIHGKVPQTNGFIIQISSASAVSNLTVKFPITNNSTAGGICNNNYGTITNCFNQGNITGGVFVGGISGYNSGTITGCSNTGEISGNAGSLEHCTGGICGRNLLTIAGCSNTARISVSGTAINIAIYAGGICGQSYNNSAKIYDCHNSSTNITLSGTRYNTSVAGSVVGINGYYYYGTYSFPGTVFDCCTDTSGGGLPLIGKGSTTACPGESAAHPHPYTNP